jgi:hypothetical protein
MPSWGFRLAEKRDAEAFAVWAANNPLIDQKDLIAGMKKTNPTVLTFVVEKDGTPVLFTPVYLSAVIAHLGFNPESRVSEKVKAMEVMKDGLAAFYIQYSLREIATLSKPDYGVAKWAMVNGFTQEPRNLFVLDLNREMTEAIEPATEKVV